MIEREMRLITAEAARRGHPDKFCDQIADAILDAHLNVDPKARVAVEVMATAGRIAVAGEVSSNAEVDYEAIVAEVIRKVGYKWQDLCENDEDELSISIGIHEQSPDIAAAVDGRFPGLDLGAGDQGIVYGFASDETLPRLPLPYMIAQRICVLLDEAGREIPWMGVDGKAQVSIKYTETCPYIQTIIVSVQHTADAPDKELRALVSQIVDKAVGNSNLWRPDSKLLINPSGRFVVGGLAADTGLTGRKLAVDQYGPSVHIGGGALSGKDPSKVDRTGAYAARWIARNLVAAKLCRQCEVQLAYAIGISQPVGLTVNSFGTGVKTNDELAKLVWRAFDLRLSAIISSLKLETPIYSQVSIYGHFGRTELNLPWERDDMAEKLSELAQYEY